MNDDEGSVTIEAAFGIAVLVMVAAMIVAALATLAAQIQAVDTAGAAARAHAIGEGFEPARGTVSVSENDAWVEVQAKVPAPLGTMVATARFPAENTAGASR
ncbi:hypothetical protein [Corynebacterium epidermidicanis]|uniref:TadE-like protein n=1 Tax=Corynebacterium epidermidicanis TaxID=1050174 RepID=A0A0G3GLV3_9CORY|nr:hypothetical protein [Corynebacterium epidermidicanis]AKK02176.1 hypothetical protein CEPID_01450 [Corynebacterium epidermidicanis]